MTGSLRSRTARIERAIFVLGLACFAAAFLAGGAFALTRWHRLPWGSLNHLTHVRSLRSDGEIERAIEELEAEQRVNAADPRAGMMLATLLAGTGGEGAVAALARVSENGFSPDIHARYARKLAQLGRLDELDVAIRRLTVFADDSPDAWLAIGEIHEATMRPAEAREAYTRALDLDPSSPVAARALERLGAGRASGAPLDGPDEASASDVPAARGGAQ